MRTSKTKRKAAQSGILVTSIKRWMKEAGKGGQLFEGNEIFHFLTAQIRQEEKSWLFSDTL